MQIRLIIALIALAIVSASCSQPTSDAPLPSTTASSVTSTTVSSIATTTTTSATATTQPQVPNTTTGPTGPDVTLLYSNYVRVETFTETLDLDIHAPDEIGPWPVVVVVHGGGWITGERLDTGSLADGLASRGAVVYNADYRTLSLGGVFPGMVDDVACAIQFARSTAAEFTTTPDLVTVVGYSAGAHLAALAAYAPNEFGQECPSGPSQPPDAFVGLAGPYDVSQLGGLLAPLFGGTIAEVPDAWAAGNPFTWLTNAPDIPALLIHGDADRVAPLAFSEELAVALTAVGKDVTLEVLPGRSHGDVTAPRVVADRITTFLAAVAS